MIGIWLSGSVRHRAGRLLGTTAGVAIAVALLATLAAFLSASRATMTARAIRDVAVDWQVQVQPGADPSTAVAAARTEPGSRYAAVVGFGQITGISAVTGTTTQSTGAGIALGLPSDYRGGFPEQIRTLVGTDRGVLLAQQTAANLHAAPGDSISIARATLPPVTVRVDAVVELAAANSLFQTVGAPPGSQPSAPPDTVVLLPDDQWRAVFSPLAAVRPDLVSTQVQLARSAPLPADPATAYAVDTAAAHHLEAASSGTLRVGDNLGASLDAARSDAGYAQILFLFLGLPGAVLAGMLTAVVSAAGAERRRREQALARLRGARNSQLLRLAAVEAALVGSGGALVGLAVGGVAGRVAFGTPVEAVVGGGGIGGALAGLVIAVATVLAPAWRDLRHATVASARQAPRSTRSPWWSRYGLDAVLLVGGGLLVWAAAGTGGQLVLAPEGVASISVSYWAFAGPALLWLGTGLLVARLTWLLLGPGRRAVTALVRLTTGSLSPTAAAMMARRRTPLARAVVLLALALAFAASTATFNATYQAQAEVDAQLTNGADVTVTEPPAARIPPAGSVPLAATAGVQGVEPLQHRFAYIGADLQDLYGVRPDTVGGVTALRDNYFQGGSATGLMRRLAEQPDSVLVSAETVTDYQLHPGDALNLRLRDDGGALITVPFHYIGVVSEFPTAPRDSFVVANAGYVAQRTGSDAVGAFLIDTGGRDTSTVADRLRARLGTSATVTDIAHTRSTVNSSLTAVDLAGLTRLELAFALLIAVAAGGLVVTLGLVEQRRAYAVITALGARPRQVRSLIAAETTVVFIGGTLSGAASGWLLSHVLVTVLTGVFDPPPSSLAVPWPYLGAVAATTSIGLAAATAGAARWIRSAPISVLREP